MIIRFILINHSINQTSNQGVDHFPRADFYHSMASPDGVYPASAGLPMTQIPSLSSLPRRGGYARLRCQWRRDV